MNKKPFNIFSLVCLGFFGLMSCEPDEIDPTPLASFSVTNAAPGSPTVDVLVDGIVTSANRLGFRTTTVSKSGSSLIYLPIESGGRNLSFSVDSGKTTHAEATASFNTGGIYSFFLYDTVVNGKMKVLRLNDDLTLPSGTNAHVRFLNLAPKAGPVDVTLVRGTLYDDTTVSSATPVRRFVAVDSITIAGKAYPGTDADVSALSAFTPLAASTGAAIPKAAGAGNIAAGSRNNRYQIKVKTAGTQNVLTRIETATFTLNAGKIYTIYISGTAQNTALTINTITNY